MTGASYPFHPTGGLPGLGSFHEIALTEADHLVEKLALPDILLCSPVPPVFPTAHSVDNLASALEEPEAET